MSSINLYKYTREDNVIDKNIGNYPILSFQNGTLKDNTDMINPVVRIKSLTNLIKEGYNYCYISDFDKYYFIINFKVLNNNLYDIYLTEDVLYTFKDGILAQEVLLSRSKDYPNHHIADNKASFESKKQIIYLEGGMFTNLNSALNDTDYHFVVETISTDIVGNTYGGINVPADSQYNLPEVSTTSTGNLETTNMVVMNGPALRFFLGAVVNDNNFNSFLKGVTVLPYVPDTLANMSNRVYIGGSSVSLGSTNLCGYLTYSTPKRFRLGYVSIQPQDNVNLWKNYGDYTKYELYIPYVGYIDVPPEFCLGTTIVVYVTPNYSDATAQFEIYYLDIDSQEFKLFYSTVASFGVKLSINVSNQSAIDAQRTAVNTSTLIGTISGGVKALSVGALGSAILGNPLPAISGVATGITSGMNLIQQNTVTQTTLFPTCHVKNASSFYGAYNKQTIHMKITTSILSLYSNVTDLIGYRSNRKVLISNLNNYFEVQEVFLDSISKANKTEKDLIKRELLSGVFPK